MFGILIPDHGLEALAQTEPAIVGIIIAGVGVLWHSGKPEFSVMPTDIGTAEKKEYDQQNY